MHGSLTHDEIIVEAKAAWGIRGPGRRSIAQNQLRESVLRRRAASPKESSPIASMGSRTGRERARTKLAGRGDQQKAG